MRETKDSVKIRHLMEQADRLPKSEALVVLKTLLVTVAEEDDDWDRVLSVAIERVEERKEVVERRSAYRIPERKATTFVKLFRIVYDLHLFETVDGRYVSNYEDFICDLGLYFNTEIRYPRNLLSSAKRTDSFMDVFDRLHELAQAYYEKGDGQDGGKRDEVRERQQRIDFDGF